MATACRQQASLADCRAPGDFCWLVAIKDGVWTRQRPAEPEERPTHIYLCLPGGLRGRLPITPAGDDDGNRGWQWDGQRERPGLSPSIDCTDGRNRWHGWLRGGVLTDA